MIINHPLLGPRDAAEFVYLGDASLMNRPEWKGEDASEAQTKKTLDAYHDYLYIRENKAGEHKELWYHEQGDRSWLVVTRHTISHEITNVELARDIATASQKKTPKKKAAVKKASATAKPKTKTTTKPATKPVTKKGGKK